MEKAKEKANVDSKRTGRAFLGEEQAQDPEWWSEEDFAWWSKGSKGKKGHSKKAMKAFRNVVFALTNHKKAQARISSRIKAEEKTKALMLNLDFQPWKHRLVFQPLA